jgi:hypothetical protein
MEVRLLPDRFVQRFHDSQNIDLLEIVQANFHPGLFGPIDLVRQVLFPLQS